MNQSVGAFGALGLCLVQELLKGFRVYRFIGFKNSGVGDLGV